MTTTYNRAQEISRSPAQPKISDVMPLTQQPHLHEQRHLQHRSTLLRPDDSVRSHPYQRHLSPRPAGLLNSNSQTHQPTSPHLSAFNRSYADSLDRSLNTLRQRYGAMAPDARIPLMKEGREPEDLDDSGFPSPTAIDPSSDGPVFEATRQFVPLYTSDTNTPLQIQLRAKLNKGFFLSNSNKWTCYRRNYFQVSAAYVLVNPMSSAEVLSRGIEEGGLLLDQGTGLAIPIVRLHVSISARVYGEETKDVSLVQHTPKRDKGPQLKPKLRCISSGGDTDIQPIPANSDAEDSDHEHPSADGVIQSVATWERLQFKQATANNGKRKAAQQYFCIVVEMIAEIPLSSVVHGQHDQNHWGPQFIRIATTQSTALVVRGRSPGHYSDGLGTSGQDRFLSHPTDRRSETRESSSEEQAVPQALSSQHHRPPPTHMAAQNLVNPQLKINTMLEAPRKGSVPHDHVNSHLSAEQILYQNILNGDFNGYQYLPFTLLDPMSGTPAIPHDLFMEPHEHADQSYNPLYSEASHMNIMPTSNNPASNRFESYAIPKRRPGEQAAEQPDFRSPPDEDQQISPMGTYYDVISPSFPKPAFADPFSSVRIQNPSKDSAAPALLPPPTHKTQSSTSRDKHLYPTVETQAAQNVVRNPIGRSPYLLSPNRRLSEIFSSVPDNNNSTSATAHAGIPREGSTVGSSQWLESLAGTDVFKQWGEQMLQFSGSSAGFFPFLPTVGENSGNGFNTVLDDRSEDKNHRTELRAEDAGPESEVEEDRLESEVSDLSEELDTAA